MNKMQKPKTRSKIRLKLGQMYHTYKRYLFWRFGGLKFAKLSGEGLPHVHFSHSTPLLRNLRNIDMAWEQNKITNLQIALRNVHMVTLQPGETFSLWRQVGRPTARKGYLEGVALNKGKFIGVIGGGLCHLSGFIYWMTLHTPLTVTERHRHGYDTTPDKLFGSDATCFYNYKDLMVTNNTDHAFQLHIRVDGEHMTGAWVSAAPPKHKYEIYEKAGEVRKEEWGAYTRHNHLHRKVFDLDNTQVGDEFVAQNSAIMMYPPEV